MTRLKAIEIDASTEKQIADLSRMVGKPEKVLIGEMVKIGLKSYQTTPSKSAQAALDLIAWAEEENITGQVTDLSTNHNKYAWEK